MAVWQLALLKVLELKRLTFSIVPSFVFGALQAWANNSTPKQNSTLTRWLDNKLSKDKLQINDLLMTRLVLRLYLELLNFELYTF